MNLLQRAKAWYDGWPVVVRKAKGRGPGHWGHAGRPGQRGGSLPGVGRFTGGLAAALKRSNIDHKVSGNAVEVLGKPGHTRKRLSGILDKALTKLGFSPTTPPGRGKYASEYAHIDGRMNADVEDTAKGIKATFYE